MIRGTLSVLAAAGVLALAPAAGAATFTVNSTADVADQNTGDGVCRIVLVNACTLRAAIQQANASVGRDAIVVPAGTYSTGSTLTVTSPIDITAPAGARSTVIDGPAAARTMTVTAGGDMVWRGLTFTGAQAGLVSSGAELRLEGVAVRDNGPAVDDGAGIQVSGGVVTLVRSAVSGNTIAFNGVAFGGGISVRSGAQLVAEHSTVHGNAATTTGTTAYGGGIGTYAGAAATLSHVTLSDNRVASTSAAQDGGNLFKNPASSVTVGDSILTGGVVFGPNNCGASKPVAAGRNLESADTCGFGAGHLTGTDPLLAAFDASGGPTDSRRPANASPARDAALSCPSAARDQRGAPAPTGPACDIGAVEIGADLVTTVTASRASVPPGGDVTYLVRVRNAGLDPAPAAKAQVSAPGATVVFAESSEGPCGPATACDLGDIAPGSSAIASVVVRAPASGVLAVSAAATSGLADPTPADASATRSTPVDVPAPVVPPATPTPSPTPLPGPTLPGPAVPPAADRTAPRLGALRAVARVRRARAARIRTTLSEDASVLVRVERVVPGRRAAGRCRTGRRTGSRCSIFRLVGTVRATGRAGTVTLRIPARVRGRALARGRHRLVVTAADAAGNRSAARRLTVTVAR